MRLLRYNVAASLDGYIAREDGRLDWISMDPAIDFAALFAEFDLFVMGGRTYAETIGREGPNPLAGQRVLVVSRTLPPPADSLIEVVGENFAARVAQLKGQPGKDLWLFGGARLARLLLDARLVDTVEVASMPVLLAGGVPLVGRGAAHRLALEKAVTLPSGIQLLRYAVRYD